MRCIYDAIRGAVLSNMPTWFGGNILPPEKERTASDHTFRYSGKDAKALVRNVVGKDVRLEHDEQMTVGRIQKAFTDASGRVYVVGRIDADDKQTKHQAFRVFADNALGGLYNALSLKHVYEEDVDGSNPRKSAVEVSLVNEPRRKGCAIMGIQRSKRAGARVAHAASSRRGASENCEYIPDPQGTNTQTLPLHPRTSVSPSVMSSTSSTEPTKAEGTPVPASVSVPTPVAQPAAAQPAAAQPAAPAAPAAPADNGTAKEEDVTMTNVIGALVSQVRRLLRLRLIERYDIVALPCDDASENVSHLSHHTLSHLSVLSG